MTSVVGYLLTEQASQKNPNLVISNKHDFAREKRWLWPVIKPIKKNTPNTNATT